MLDNVFYFNFAMLAFYSCLTPCVKLNKTRDFNQLTTSLYMTNHLIRYIGSTSICLVKTI